ncbi:phage baseplate assembly protein V [Paenibacillus albilobatus]|nr:phage baseplate assembly protein V [Paenibacillus albilobatus]
MSEVENVIRRMIRIGDCSSADPEMGTIRATFSDLDDMVSGDLPVLTPGGWGKGNALPEPGESVLCIFLSNGIEDGVCLGAIDDEDVPPGTPDQRGIYFEDGSEVYYDRTNQQIVVKTAGGVSIEGDVTIKGDLTVSGGITRGGEEI